MSNKLIKYKTVECYICSDDEKKLRARFAFLINWARQQRMNCIYDRAKHSVTFKFPQDKLYYTFIFGKESLWEHRTRGKENVLEQVLYLQIYDSPAEFVETVVNDMSDYVTGGADED